MTDLVTPDATPEPQPISYAEFGHNFVYQVVTAHRIGSEIKSAFESTIAGSVKKLPADMLVVSYVFNLRDITVDPQLDALPRIAFILGIHGEIKLDVKLMNVNFKFSMTVVIRIHIDVATYAPVTLKLLPQKVTGNDIQIQLMGDNAPGEVLDSLQVVRPIVREQIVREVNARIQDPDLQARTTIDVLALVNQMGDRSA